MYNGEPTKDVLIQKFLDGELNNTETRRLKELFDTDPEFADELRSASLLIVALKAEVLADQEHVLIPEHRPRNKTWYISIAASVCLLIGAYFGLHVQDRLFPLNNNEIYGTYFTPFEAPKITIRSPEAPSPSDLQMAFDSYEQQKYGQALKVFEQYSKANPNHSLVWFYIGNCYLSMNGKEAAAVPAFKKVIELKDYDFIDEARWYLALAYIKIDDNENAIEQLKIIEEKEGRYYEKAARILRMVD